MRWIVFPLICMFLQPAAYPPRRLRLLLCTMNGCLPCRFVKDELKRYEKAGWDIGAADWNHIQIVDSRRDHEVCDQYGVSSFPTFILTYDGKAIWTRTWRSGDTAQSFTKEATDNRNAYAIASIVPVVENELAAGEQPTPLPGVQAMLDALRLRPEEVLLDPGCGVDARILIEACKRGTRRAVGIEIDPEIAESARQHVAEAGLSDRITIITGDSTEVDWMPLGVTVGAGYMWPEVLLHMRGKIQSLNRFASFAFEVPGLEMKELRSEAGTVHLWERQPVQQAVAPVRMMSPPVIRSGIIHLPRGSFCQVCGRYCSNPMAHRLIQQSR